MKISKELNVLDCSTVRLFKNIFINSVGNGKDGEDK